MSNVTLVREAIFTVLDEREWNFEDDEQRVDFADRVASFIPSETQRPMPEGWKLVPVDPTLEMLEAAADAYDGSSFRERRMYKAMLEAAPETIQPECKATPMIQSSDKPNAHERLRLAMLFIEEWANWWAYGLGLDDSKPLSAEETAAAEKMADSIGARARDMVIDNRRFLASVTSAIAPSKCPYCTSDNPAIRSTYYDQTCEGCVKRMGKP